MPIHHLKEDSQLHEQMSEKRGVLKKQTVKHPVDFTICIANKEDDSIPQPL